MKIRKAILSDLQIIQKLNNQLFELEFENYDKNLIKNWALTESGKKYFENAIKKDFVVVAEVDNRVVGYLLGQAIKISYYDFKIAELCNMCIDDNYRGKGIGFALYKEFENYYINNKIDNFTVTASYKNESAKNFYKKLGFAETNITLMKLTSHNQNLLSQNQIKNNQNRIIKS